MTYMVTALHPAPSGSLKDTDVCLTSGPVLLRAQSRREEAQPPAYNLRQLRPIYVKAFQLQWQWEDFHIKANMSPNLSDT